MSLDPQWERIARQREVKQFGDVLKEFLRTREGTEGLKLKRLADAWRQAVGSDVANQSRVVAFRKGTLVVEVRSTALLYELKGFRKQEILQRIQADEATSDVADLHVKIGRWSSSHRRK